MSAEWRTYNKQTRKTLIKELVCLLSCVYKYSQILQKTGLSSLAPRPQCVSYSQSNMRCVTTTNLCRLGIQENDTLSAPPPVFCFHFVLLQIPYTISTTDIKIVSLKWYFAPAGAHTENLSSRYWTSDSSLYKWNCTDCRWDFCHMSTKYLKSHHIICWHNMWCVCVCLKFLL